MSDHPTPDREDETAASAEVEPPEGPGDARNQDSAADSGFLGMGVTIGIGAGIGLIFGTMLDNLALGLACGAGLGTVAGAILESRRERP